MLGYNRGFVEAVKRTGRRKLIIAGVSTEVCVAFVALSAVKDGFDAYAVIDASGTWNKLVQQVAVARVAQAGVKPITWVAVGAETAGGAPRRASSLGPLWVSISHSTAISMAASLP